MIEPIARALLAVITSTGITPNWEQVLYVVVLIVPAVVAMGILALFDGGENE